MHTSHYCRVLAHAATTETNDFSTCSLFHSTQEELAQLEDINDLVSRLDQIQCSETCFAAALVYIDRITNLEAGGLVLNHHTMHKLVLTSVLVAHQFLDDSPGSALSFADAAGFDPKLVADLKTEFLFMLEFDLMIAPEELATYSDLLYGRFSSQHFPHSGLWAGIPPQDNDPTHNIDYPVISVSHPNNTSVASNTQLASRNEAAPRVRRTCTQSDHSLDTASSSSFESGCGERSLQSVSCGDILRAASDDKRTQPIRRARSSI
eukprot:c16987_g1_i1.p1 GENE.c16987_g1_i1~~c16987_g1_i1.p1  ORF type:complete len:264 (+),score=33.97 c16987_g1_i1:76-867(+)